MCHPGIFGDELRVAQTRLKVSRERELRALTDARVLEALREADVVLTNYRRLDQQR